ncbi:phosphatidate cytidylyltransferase, partial [Microvirga sp. 3-52]|nr:phosphatidate cytidylyltransferase [Microvirga sp. 3-52]
MKQRIITAIIALAFFTPFVIIGGWPFTLVIYAIATIGLYEILRMRNIKLVSIPGVLTWVALAVLLIPSAYEQQFYDTVGYTKIELAFAVTLLLLIHTVIVKNRFTFDHAAFSILGALYIGIGFYYFIETRLFGIEYVLYALIVIW